MATQKAKQSPKAGRFETNTKAKIWTFKDPNNRTHTFTNLMHFVRQNPHLFDASDVIWRKKANGVVHPTDWHHWHGAKRQRKAGKAG